MFKFRLFSLGRNARAVTLCLFQCIVSRDVMLLILITIDINFDQLNKVISARFLHYKVVIYQKMIFFIFIFQLLLVFIIILS